MLDKRDDAILQSTPITAKVHPGIRRIWLVNACESTSEVLMNLLIRNPHCIKFRMYNQLENEDQGCYSEELNKLLVFA